MSKIQEASSILKVVLALSKWPHLHRAYLVTVRFHLVLAVKNVVYLEIAKEKKQLN